MGSHQRKQHQRPALTTVHCDGEGAGWGCRGCNRYANASSTVDVRTWRVGVDVEGGDGDRGERGWGGQGWDGEGG